ncbi:MAG: hypothetical protein OEY91_08805 [Nitrospirota bacterium]|nr:hypothetical protein [Nitrospirota bacterium]
MKAGLHVIMLTGDHHQVAKTIASDLGMTHFLTEILPDQKAAEIQKLQNQGKRVAVETAQITLMSGDIRGIHKAMQLSRTTMGTIHQNFRCAFSYNLVLIPLAAAILYRFFNLETAVGREKAVQTIYVHREFLQCVLTLGVMRDC